jgi:hypothetical protein
MRFVKKIHTHYIVVRIIKIEHSNQSPNQVNLHAFVYVFKFNTSQLSGYQHNNGAFAFKHDLNY